jgi:hypothetical protein
MSASGRKEQAETTSNGDISYFRNVQPTERKEIKCSRRKEKKSNGLNVIRNFIAKEVKQGMIRDIDRSYVQVSEEKEITEKTLVWGYQNYHETASNKMTSKGE